MFKISLFSVFRVGSRVRFCSDKPKPPRSNNNDFGGHLEWAIGQPREAQPLIQGA